VASGLSCTLECGVPSYLRIIRGSYRRTTTGRVAATEACGMKAIRRSSQEKTMTNHTAGFSPRSRQARKAAPASYARPVAPATSSVLAGLLMATGIGWNAGLEAQPFHQVMVGIFALAIHVVPLIAVVIVVVRAWRGGADVVAGGVSGAEFEVPGGIQAGEGFDVGDGGVRAAEGWAADGLGAVVAGQDEDVVACCSASVVEFAGAAARQATELGIV
jgi:hypothetical protein